MARASSQTAIRPRALARDALTDGVMGGALGLMVVLILVTGNLDLREALEQSGAPLVSLTALVVTMFLQFAVVAGVCGAALRNLIGYD